MMSVHVFTGLLVLAGTVVFLAWRYAHASKVRRLPWWGWLGLAVIALSEGLLAMGWRWAGIWITPWAWTGYILLVDGLVASLRGESMLTRSFAEFASLALWSVPLWLLFEAYNLRLNNWTYVGIPESAAVQAVGFVWAFATIWPAIFETGEFLQALGLFPAGRGNPRRFSPATRATFFTVGLAFVTVPILLPERFGSYVFGAVWVGFVFLLDPVNYAWKGRSLLGELEAGVTSTLWCFMASGAVCGILWEFWNYWATSKWVYVFPIGQGTKIFEMPLAGFLGFPPFALECLVMYEFVRGAASRAFKLKAGREWQTAGSLNRQASSFR